MNQGERTDRTGWETGDELILALGEKYTPEILRATHEPRSARELSDELDIPEATCYRRLGKLSELGVLEEARRIKANAQGTIKVYSRQIEDIHIGFSGDDLEVTAEDTADAETTVDGVWHDLNSD